MKPFLILKATSGNQPEVPEAPARTDPVPPWEDDQAQPAVVEPIAPEPVEAVSEEAEPDLKLGQADRLDEARRYADMGKAMRLVDPERPHEAHLVGPDLADPSTWRHTLLVDDEPFSDQEFDRAEDAFMSALQTGVVPAGAPDPGPADFDLDRPFAPEA